MSTLYRSAERNHAYLPAIRFLWAAIQLDQLSRLHSDRAIKNALGNLPRGLDETYIQILHKIQEENPDSIESVKAMLRWLVGSANPLTLDQLAEAISIEPNDTYRDSDAIATDPRDVLTLCRSLVRVDHHERSRSPFVHLAHLSIQEYITSPRILGSPVAEFYLDPIDTVARLAKTSIQYLQLLDFKLPCLSQADLETRIQAYPFLRSAAQQWHVQVRRALDNGSLSIDELIRSLRWFLSTDLVEQHYASWRQAYQFPSTVQEIKAMYYAVLFGLEPLVEYLLETGVDVNDSVLETGIDSIHPVEHGPFGFNDWTALHVASFSGHANLVRILVAKGALLEARMGTRALTPLHIAAEVANKDVVEVLISAGASIHATSHSGTTAFYRAARGGSVKILELLYKAGSDINVQTWDHWTPVFEAIEMGREDVLNKLLSWGARLQVVNDAERTPLLTAVSFERPRMVQKIANKLRQIARTEGRTPFTDEAESHTLKGQSVPSSIIRICCQCRTPYHFAIQAEACVSCHHYFCGNCKTIGRCIALRNEDLQTTSAKPLPKKSVTEARAALDDQEK